MFFALTFILTTYCLAIFHSENWSECRGHGPVGYSRAGCSVFGGSETSRRKRQMDDMLANDFGLGLGQREAAPTTVIAGSNVNGLGWFSGRAKVDKQELLKNAYRDMFGNSQFDGSAFNG
uniref:Uncharacterized protein n=1 Tax=Ditylenchus dipsaci TaxID=166011 RepID=A0A915DS58_9BILA